MSRKLTVETFPEEIKEELLELLAQGQLTQAEIAESFSRRGFTLSKTALSRYWIRYRIQSKRLDSVGISQEVYKKYNAEFEELAWKLLKREILSDKNQDNERKIEELKEKIPLFTENADD